MRSVAVWTRQWTVFTALLAAAACGDPPLSAGSSDVASADADAKISDAVDGAQAADADGENADVAADAESDAVVADAADGTDAAEDGADSDAAVGAEIVDSGGDSSTDFYVVSTSPADGTAGVANPFSFTVTCNDKVKAVVIGPNTVTVSVAGSIIDGKWSVSGNSFTFTASSAVLAATRVDVTLSPLVQSEIGYSLQNQTSFHFYVRGYDGMAPYEKLAQRYAPTIRQAVADGNDKYDQLRRFDYDENWQAGDNGLNFSKFPALAQIGWSVIETPSHFFVTYVYFWPHRTAVNNQAAFDNDAAGATVAIGRWPTEHPVALTTWWKQKSVEEMWTWVTTESGLPKTGYVRGVYAEATLFPQAKANDTWGCEGITGCQPRRFQAFLTSGNHQSCLWLDAGDVLNCTNNLSTQAALTWIDYAPGATPTEPAAAANPGPVATYGLYSTYDTWWPRREDTGATGLFADKSFLYVPPDKRPAGVKVNMGSKFYNKDNDFSRPPWGWHWKGADYYDMPAGTPFLDPAWANSKRFLSTSSPIPDFDASKKTGWSQEYCFNPYLYIDQRSTANCTGSLP